MKKHPSDRPPHPNRLLWQAVAVGDRAAGRTALAAGANPGTRYGCWSVLGKALRDHRAEMAQDLIEAGAPVDQDDAHVGLLARAAALELDACHAALVARRAPLTVSALEAAALAANGPAVERLLAAGCSAWGEEEAYVRTRAVVFGWTPVHAPVPPVLMKTIDGLDDARWERVAADAALGRRIDVWGHMLASANATAPERVHELAFHAMRFGWVEGFDAATLAGAARSQPQLPYPGSVVAACLSRLFTLSKKRPGLALLGRVLEAGYPVDVGVPLRGNHNLDTLVPLPIWLVEHHKGSPTELHRILGLLADHGADLQQRPDALGMTAESDTVVHQAIVLGKWATVAWLGKRLSGVNWEAGGACGLWALVAGRAELAEIKKATEVLLKLNPPPSPSALGAPQGGAPGNALHAVADRIRGAYVPIRGVPTGTVAPLVAFAQFLIDLGTSLENDQPGRGRAWDRLMEVVPEWMGRVALERRLQTVLGAAEDSPRRRL